MVSDNFVAEWIGYSSWLDSDNFVGIAKVWVVDFLCFFKDKLIFASDNFNSSSKVIA